MQPEIAVVILNLHGGTDTVECLSSLLECEQSGHLHLIVLDNGSGEDDITLIEGWMRGSGCPFNILDAASDDATPPSKPRVESATARCTLIKSPKNLGFCDGNNFGAAYGFEAGADYALILNNDTLADKSFVADLLRALENDDGNTLFSPQIARADAPGKIWWFGGIFTRTLLPLYLDKGSPIRSDLDQPLETEWVSGCATIISRSVYECIGLFDPVFFIWADEWDLSLRAKAAHINMRILPKPRLYHKIGRSLGVISPMVFFYSFRNLIILRRRYLPAWKYWLIQLIDRPRKLGSAIKLAIRFKDWSYIQAYFDALASSRRGGMWRRQQ